MTSIFGDNHQQSGCPGTCSSASKRIVSRCLARRIHSIVYAIRDGQSKRTIKDLGQDEISFLGQMLIHLKTNEF